VQALWHYYDEHVDELDLGFYLYQGTKPVGLKAELNAELNRMLDKVVVLIARALADDQLASDEEVHLVALAHITSVFGLVLVAKTGRLRSLGAGGTPDDVRDVLSRAWADPGHSRRSLGSPSTTVAVSLIFCGVSS